MYIYISILLLVYSAHQKDLTKAANGKSINLITVHLNLIGHEQTFHMSWCITAGPYLFWLWNSRHGGNVIFVIVAVIL